MKKILIALAFILLTSSSVWAVPLLQDQQNNDLYEKQEKFRCAEGFSTGRYDANGNEICKESLNNDWQLIDPPKRDPIEPKDPEIGGGTTTTATVSSCPSGTTKSSDGCCCVNN